MHTALGTLRCSLKKPDSDQNWWMVLDSSTEEIGRYYRHLYRLEHSKAGNLAKPYWGAHVTVVRNEEPPNAKLWWNYDGETVEFSYRSGVRTNFSPERFRSFWWVDVVCPRFDAIREELGLTPNPDRTYHMTIGSAENEKNRAVYERMWAGSGKTQS